MSPPIHPLASSQGAVFLINSRQGDFRCGPTAPRETRCAEASLSFIELISLQASGNEFISESSTQLTSSTKLYKLRHHIPCDAVGQALSLTYGRFFAEFLEDLSLVHLSLLDQTTGVGLRYGFSCIVLRRFSWKRALYHSPSLRKGSRIRLG